MATEKSPYNFKPFAYFDESATNRSSNRDSKDQIECSIVDFSVLNGFKSYSCILDFHVSFFLFSPYLH